MRTWVVILNNGDSDSDTNNRRQEFLKTVTKYFQVKSRYLKLRTRLIVT
jgi:hypothetical protein